MLQNGGPCQPGEPRSHHEIDDRSHLSANNLYGGTYQLFHYTFPKLGRKVLFVDSSRPEEFEKAMTERTRAIYAETIGNPKRMYPISRLWPT